MQKEQKENIVPHVGAFAVAVPPYSADQEFAEAFMRKHFSGRLSNRSQGLLRAIFSHPSIRKRHFAFDDPREIVDEGPDRRVARFTERSIGLAAQAITQAIDRAGISAGEIDGIVVNTCTGYICPGISTYLIERLGLSRSIRAYDLVGSGCGGAIPNLQLAETLVRSGSGAVLSVSVEICSTTFQMDNDLSLILSNALFGDGASAAVVWGRREGWELSASAAHYAPEHRETIRYVHKNGLLFNRLSLRLPDLVSGAASAVVSNVLAQRALGTGDIRHWALHTGGEKIINAVRDGIGIPEASLGPTRRVLREYGNMSSPTVWFVLDEIEKNPVAQGDWAVMVAYGAGLSGHAYLLRRA